MPRGRSYRNHKKMRQRLRAETECYALLERRRNMVKKRVNRQIDMSDPAMVKVLQRKAALRYEEALDELEYEVDSFQMRKIAREGKLHDFYTRWREEQDNQDAQYYDLKNHGKF